MKLQNSEMELYIDLKPALDKQQLDKRLLRDFEKMQNKIAAKRKEYDAMTEELQKLLEERYPEKKSEKIKNTLYEAYSHSDRSLMISLQL